MSNKNKIILVIIITLFIIYALYKSFNLYYYTYIYTTDNEIRIMNYKKINIKTLRMISNSKHEQLHINIPQEFKYNKKISEQDPTIKLDWYIKEKNNNEKKSPSITIAKSVMDIEYFLKEGGVRKGNYNKVLEQYDIKNCFDLIEYYKKHQNEHQTIFTPISKIKMNHLSKTYVYFNLASFKKVYKLNGGIEGYIFETPSGSYFIYLIYNNDIYILNLNNTEEDKYFTYQKVIEILQTVYFE